MAKDKNLLPDPPEVDEETGDVIDPEEQKALDKFYREHPDAMRKWVDTDTSAFGKFQEAYDAEVGEDEEDLEEEDEDEEFEKVDDVTDTEPTQPEEVENAFCPTGEGGGVDPSCSSHSSGVSSLSSFGSKITKHPPSVHTSGLYSGPNGATPTEFSGTAEVGGLKTTVFRVGPINAKSRSGGTFFGGDAESIKSYQGNHAGHEVKEYKVELNNVIVAGHQNDLTQAWFGKSYGRMMDSFQSKLGRTEGASGATAAFDKKIFTEAKKRGFDGIVYISPAAPAKTELAVVGDATKKVKERV